MLFNKWGTYTFEPDFMRQTIGFGEPLYNGIEFIGFDRTQNPSVLHLEIWLEFVPEVYRKKCRQIGEDMANSLIGNKVSDSTIDLLIVKILQRINDEVEPNLQ